MRQRSLLCAMMAVAAEEVERGVCGDVPLLSVVLVGGCGWLGHCVRERDGLWVGDAAAAASTRRCCWLASSYSWLGL